jgi:hypothetical protein
MIRKRRRLGISFTEQGADLVRREVVWENERDLVARDERCS